MSTEHIEFMSIVTAALRHQAEEHGGVVLLADDRLCPDGAVLLCGASVMARLKALYEATLAQIESTDATKH